MLNTTLSLLMLHFLPFSESAPQITQSTQIITTVTSRGNSVYKLSAYSNSESNRQSMLIKLNTLRYEVMRLFNQHTPNTSLHFSCSTNTKLNPTSCDKQFTWKQKISASNSQRQESVRRDKAVLDQLKVLIRSNAEFRQIYNEFKQTEKAYLNSGSN